jgi:hypothetical protein
MPKHLAYRPHSRRQGFERKEALSQSGGCPVNWNSDGAQCFLLSLTRPIV